MSLLHAFRLTRWLARAGAASSLLAASLLAAPPAIAQSAADKSTARQLAVDGIKLHRDGKYTEALDKLRRAQALYDAPVHLLYIARCQVALNKAVEAAETYRTLVRTQLDAGASQAFRDAVADGEKELQKLEPKIPALRVDVKPDGVADLDLRIDGQPVSAAIVGVDRPINPGQHKIQAAAPGFQPTEQMVVLKIGEKKQITVELAPGQGALPPPGPVGPTTGPGPGPQPGPGPAPGPGPGPGPGPEPTPAEPSSKFQLGFMAGLRLGAAIPTGNVVENAAGKLAFSDIAGAGGGGEIHGGVRLARYFTPVLYFARYQFKPGVYFDNLAVNNPAIESADTNNVFMQDIGIGLIVGTARGRFGGFGELDLLLVHQFQAVSKVTILGNNCDRTEKLNGSAFRIGGGAHIPIGEIFHLTPFLNFTAGTFTENEVEISGCLGGASNKVSISESDQAAHGVVMIGVGGDFLFGADKPVK